VTDYWTETGSERVDEGRYAMTGEEADRYVFRTPMLRNIARTAPYFHDGSSSSLHEAVAVMARSQLGRKLPQQDIDLIVKFLHTLTGTHQGQPLATHPDSDSP
jgi:cytochrome c peroxidase